MREIIEVPDRRFFTQGSIFDGLSFSERKIGYGIVITARCDIANCKSKNILCLPIYKIKDWMSVIGEDIIVRRTEKSIKAVISKYFSELGLPPNAIDIYPKNTLIESIKNTNEKTNIELKQLIESYKDKKFNTEIKTHKKEKETLLNSILNNSESSAYFIEQVYTDRVLEGHVVDLTDPISISFKIAEELKKGLSKDTRLESEYFKIESDDYYYSYISTLKSPYIEHLLQKFSLHYSRIGTQDLDSESRKIIQEQYENA